MSSISEKNRSGLAHANPLLILLLGACPAMAQSADVLSALYMGGTVLAVTVLSALVLSLLRKVIPAAARLWACLIVVTGFVSLAQMLLHAFLPQGYRMLGVYLAVLAVDLLVFGLSEDALDLPAGTAVLGSLLTGVRFLLVLVLMGAVREVFGGAAFAGIAIPVLEPYRIPLLLKAPGGFLIFALTAALVGRLCPAKGPQSGPELACAAADCETEKEAD